MLCHRLWNWLASSDHLLIHFNFFNINLIASVFFMKMLMWILSVTYEPLLESDLMFWAFYTVLECNAVYHHYHEQTPVEGMRLLFAVAILVHNKNISISLIFFFTFSCLTVPVVLHFNSLFPFKTSHFWAGKKCRTHLFIKASTSRDPTQFLNFCVKLSIARLLPCLHSPANLPWYFPNTLLSNFILAFLHFSVSKGVYQDCL